jgi:hypothetical protein
MSLATPHTVTLDLDGARQAVVDALLAAGINAVAERRDLNPPGVYVPMPTLVFNRLKGNTASLELVCAVPASSEREASKALGPLVASVVAVWPATFGYPFELTSIDGGDPLPAYRLPTPIRIS